MHPFVARTFDVVAHPGKTGVAAFLSKRRPELVLCSLLLSPARFDEVVAVLEEGAFPCVTVLFAEKEPTARLEARARSVTGAKGVFGRNRLLPRIIEALAAASRASLRVEKRATLQLSVELQVNGETLAGRMLDLSESGAKVATAHPLDVGDQVALCFENGLKLRARVVREESGTLGPTAGLHFEPFSAEGREGFERLQDLIEERTSPRARRAEVVRVTRRQALPPKALDARLVPRGGQSLSPLTVKDLSETGCGVHGATRLLKTLTEGSSVSLYLPSRGGDLKLPAEVIHVRAQKRGTSLAGLRFIELARGTRAKLDEVISLARGGGQSKLSLSKDSPLT